MELKKNHCGEKSKKKNSMETFRKKRWLHVLSSPQSFFALMLLDISVLLNGLISEKHINVPTAILFFFILFENILLNKLQSKVKNLVG